MAAEKACKAYLTVRNSRENVKKSHAYVARTLPIIARKFYGGSRIFEWEIRQIQRLAREIQALAPACDGGDVREDNAEYPWEDSQGKVQIPCEYKFARIDDKDRTLVLLIRLIRTAAESYAEEQSTQAGAQWPI